MPGANVGLAGVKDIDTRTAGVTVTVVEEETLLEAAEIVVVPVAMAVASPCEPAALLMLATPAAEELQTTLPVTFCVLPSVNVPVAVNC